MKDTVVRHSLAHFQIASSGLKRPQAASSGLQRPQAASFPVEPVLAHLQHVILMRSAAARRISGARFTNVTKFLIPILPLACPLTLQDIPDRSQVISKILVITNILGRVSAILL
jgi:hypothetical protein